MAAGTPHSSPDPHGEEPLVSGGTELADATAAIIAVHGRGATAESIIRTVEPFHRDGIALLAPQAAANTWYPNSFLAPVEQNEPGRSSGLNAIGEALETATDAGIPTERVLLIGFSQGACLASEFLARRPDRYGGLAVLSGGLIGETIDPAEYDGDLVRTPVVFGCSDVDPHIPEQRVHDSATVFERLNAAVTVRIYDGMGHTINDDERETVDAMAADLVAGS